MIRSFVCGRAITAVSLLVAGIAHAGLASEVRERVEADWARQEGALGQYAGTEETIRGVIERGRALATDEAFVEHPERVAEMLGRLDAVEQRLETIDTAADPEDDLRADPLESDDGWHLVRAAVCGAGPELDTGRVRGEDWDYGSPMVREGDFQTWPVTTISFDSEVIVYRFDELPSAAGYRLRTVCASESHRTMAVSVNGHDLGEIAVPPGLAIEQVAPLPEGIAAEGAVTIEIGYVAGANAVVSALELWSDRPETDPSRRERLQAQYARTKWTPPPSVTPEMRTLYTEARWAVRDLLLSNPVLDFEELLFVKRQWPLYNHQCSHRVGEAQTPGANLSILTGLNGDGVVRDLLPEDYAQGGIGRPDLSYDGQRIVFPYAQPRTPPTEYGYGRYAYRGGACHMYDIYEIGVDGTGLRRLTHSLESEDTEPAYLPDGRIVFTSSRDGQLVQCGDWALVFGLHVMEADGSDQRSITVPQDSEFYPSLLDDGRILYTRWDYVMKPYNVIQQLWSVNPDGTHSQLAYGHWYAFSRGPIALFEARQIPGSSWVAAVGAAHHNTGVGPIVLADLDQNRGGPSGMVNITPHVGYPETPGMDDERTDTSGPEIRLIGATQNASGWYASPWPLSERFFLVAYSFEPNNAAPHGYGLYLLDTYGNKELLHRGDDYSVYAPIPLRPRPRPATVASVLPPDAAPDTPGRLYVEDVYQGLEGVPRGTVQWLRINETYPKMQHTWPARSDVGVGSGWDMRGVLGVVPVEADGSAYFEAPPNRMLFFQALDGEFREVRRMTNYVNLQPGEVRGCVGCHESPQEAAVVNRLSTALSQPPRLIDPPPWGAGPMEFERVVQPVLDRHCIGCHDGGIESDHAFDLRGLERVAAPHEGDVDEGPQHVVSDSFLALLPHVEYLKMDGYRGRKLPPEPYETGSAVSPLMDMLREGHHNVQLSEADWRALAAWIDSNAPYYGRDDAIENVDGEVPPHVIAQHE